MGAVYRAISTEEGPAGPAGTVVALKFFHPELVEDERSFRRFRREAEIGKAIRHPHIVRTYEIASEEIDGQSCPYLVLEFIEGQTLKSLVAELGTVPPSLLQQVADQALDALQAIHDRGIIHRDIKPENIVITADHRVLLMDLGIAKETDASTQLTEAGEFLGSLIYAAPEQLFHQEDVSHRTDIYSFGATLYELATGRKTFECDEVGSLIRLKMEGEFDRPQAVNPDVDSFLDEVICTCLAKEPTSRFSSCDALRAILRDGENSAWWQDLRGEEATPATDRALKRLRVPREAALVGRANELAELRNALTAAQAGTAQTRFVMGGAGIGKSRLLHAFIEEQACAGGPVVIAGRCAGRGGRAFQAFVEAMHDLLNADEGHAAVAERLAELLESDRLVDAFANFLLGGMQPDSESEFSRDALLSLYAEVLRRTARTQSVIVVVDDLQLAGPDTADLFGFLARSLADSRVLLVGVLRPDELDADSTVGNLIEDLTRREQARTFTVEPFGAESTEELLRAVVREERTVRRLAHLVQNKSDGSPLIVLELLAHMRSSGLLFESQETLTLSMPVESIELPSTVRGLANFKLDRLDDEERETLEAAAVIGFEFSAPLLAEALEERRIKLLKRLAVLERKHRVIQSYGKDSFRFVTHHLWETVYAEINESLRSEYHSIIAEALMNSVEEPDAVGGELAYSLVRHLHYAEEIENAIPFVTSGVDYLAANYHASYAAPFLEELIEALDEADPRTRYTVRMRQWECQDALGLHEQQTAVLDDATAISTELEDTALAARAETLRAHTLWRTGDYAGARQAAGRGLGLARESGDRKWEASARHSLGAVAVRQGEFANAAEHWEAALQVRREIGDRHGEARSLTVLAAVMPEIGRKAEALQTKRDALAIFREVGDRRAQAMLLNNIGVSLQQANLFEQAVEQFREALEIKRERGDLAGEGHPRCNLAQGYAALGRVKEAKAAFREALGAFAESGVRSGEMSTHYEWGRALIVFGEHSDARVQLELALELALDLGARNQECSTRVELGTALDLLHDREAAGKQLEAALALAEELENDVTMRKAHFAAGSAALRGGDFADALPHLQQAAEGELISALYLARLARAQHECGLQEEAARTAARLEERVANPDGVSPAEGPEIYFALQQILGDQDRGLRYLGQARDLVNQRSRTVKDDAYREFLTSSWPHREIVEEAQRLLDG
jgi:tetratricopeptide (TPR) repeat protein